MSEDYGLREVTDPAAIARLNALMEQQRRKDRSKFGQKERVIIAKELDELEEHARQTQQSTSKQSRAWERWEGRIEAIRIIRAELLG